MRCVCRRKTQKHACSRSARACSLACRCLKWRLQGTSLKINTIAWNRCPLCMHEAHAVVSSLCARHPEFGWPRNPEKHSQMNRERASGIRTGRLAAPNTLCTSTCSFYLLARALVRALLLSVYRHSVGACRRRCCCRLFCRCLCACCRRQLYDNAWGGTMGNGVEGGWWLVGVESPGIVIAVQPDARCLSLCISDSLALLVASVRAMEYVWWWRL